jgi:hypothetical protein
MTRAIITRNEYMEGRASHEDYYGGIVAECGVDFKDAKDIARFREALKTDKNMNNIPLAWWDAKAQALMVYNGAAIRKALKDRGDFYSMCGGVCILKTAARMAAERKD